MPTSSLAQAAADAFRSAGDFAADLVNPTIRLGVTGLARSGKTVFITALVHNLIAGGAAALLRCGGRKAACFAPISSRSPTTPCRASNMSSISPISPATRRAGRKARGSISQLRLALEYESARFWKRQLGCDRLNIDIVDYPGEWLLDLPLLELDYRGVVARGVRAEPASGRAAASPRPGTQALAAIDPAAPADEALARSARRAVQGLSARDARRPTCAVDAAARPLPDAGRSRRLARAHLRSARRARRRSFPRGSLWRDDGAALRGL